MCAKRHLHCSMQNSSYDGLVDEHVDTHVPVRIANTAISCGRRLVRLQKFAHQACSTIVRSAYQVQRNTPVPPNLQKQQQLMAKHSLSPTRAPVKVCTSLPRTVKAESTTSAVSSFVKEKAQPRHLPAALFGHESSSNAEKT